jgi:hypothetical protein
MLTNRQATATAQPHEPPWREPTLELERIVMVDIASTLARAKKVAHCTNYEGGQTEATLADPPNASPPPTTDGVDKLY